jgi:hypothetical protein
VPWFGTGFGVVKSKGFLLSVSCVKADGASQCNQWTKERDHQRCLRCWRSGPVYRPHVRMRMDRTLFGGSDRARSFPHDSTGANATTITERLNSSSNRHSLGLTTASTS